MSKCPQIATGLFSFIGQGMNLDVTRLPTSDDSARHQVDITRIWR